MDKYLLIFGLLFILSSAVLVYNIAEVSLCFTVNGIDHNGKNEAFTLFLGDC